MAITKSAQKAARQNVRRRKRNLAYKDKIKKLQKQLKSLISQNKAKEAKTILPQIYKSLDKAAKVGIIKKNTADRKKARITKLINRNL